jgi:hypothetical protein
MQGTAVAAVGQDFFVRLHYFIGAVVILVFYDVYSYFAFFTG